MGVFLSRIGMVAKLGRVVPRTKKLVPLVTEFVRGNLPTPPATWDGSKGVPSWPMYGNDQYGDCVFACVGHEVGLWTFDAVQKERLFTDADILAMYSAVTGFDPRYPSTDNGAVITDALDFWIRRGISDDRLGGYVGVTPADPHMMRFGAWAFGGLHLGLNMPAAWQATTGPGLSWDVGPNQRGEWSPGSWGGHAVPVVSYDDAGVTVVTWSKLQKITWRALALYCDEAYACASWDWCLDGGTPTSISKADLIAYFGSLGGGPLTPPPSPPPPPPAPGPAAGVITVDPTAHTISFPAGWTAAPVATLSRPAAAPGG